MQEEVAVAARPATSHFVDLRGMRHHVNTWGDPASPRLFLLHGWMDVGASFQFLVDSLALPWYVIAPDLRGFGRSQWQPQGYWFHDYIADLEALVDHFAPPGERINLAGHSLGGNVVMSYAGVRPERIARLVSLDGFGIPDESPAKAAGKTAKWLDALKSPPAWKPYRDLDAVADRLQQNNPRLPRDKARFLAAHWATVRPDGQAELVSDPRHRLPFPTVYRMEEIIRLWNSIAAPTLWVAAAETHLLQWLDPVNNPTGREANFDGIRARLAHIQGARLEIVSGAGHMLHHDRPAAVARLIESFFTAG